MRKETGWNPKNRILYPMKRVDFDPKGERNPQNRGKSGYVRISWDEALDIVSSEIKRLTDTYGGSAITGITSSHHNWGIVGYKMGPFHRFMGMLNYTPILDNPDSWEGWHWGATHTYGFHWRLGMPPQFDLLEDGLQEYRDDRLLVQRSGYDPRHLQRTGVGDLAGMAEGKRGQDGLHRSVLQLHERRDGRHLAAAAAGLRYGAGHGHRLRVDHRREPTTSNISPRRPTASTSSRLTFWARWTTSSPRRRSGRRRNRGFRRARFVALAREWASKRTSVSCGSRGGEGSACRTAYGTEWARMMVLLQAMQGLGKPGINIWGTTMGAPANHDIWFPAYAEPRGQMGRAPIAKRQLALENKTKQRLYRLTFPEAILNGKEDFWGDGFCGKTLEQQFIHNTYPMEGHSKVKMFYRYGGSFMGTMLDTNKWVKMYQSPELEFVVMQDCWYGGEAIFPDIILPACTGLERNDLGEWAACGGYTTNAHIGNNYRVIVREQKCIEPMGESKSDYEILTLLAERLGMKELFTEGNTEDDWARLFYESSDLAKTLSWEEFEKKGYHIIPCPGRRSINPLPVCAGTPRAAPTIPPIRATPSGARIKTTNWGHTRARSSSPRKACGRTCPTTKSGPSCRIGFPPGRDTRPDRTRSIRCSSSRRIRVSRFHTHYDNHTSWLNEIPLHRVLKDGYYWWPARIHPDDAKARNVKTGDIVELYNDRASVLCIAVITGACRPACCTATAARPGTIRWSPASRVRPTRAAASIC